MLKTSLGKCNARQQISPLTHLNICQMRQRGKETAPGFLKCCGLKCAPSCKRQIANQSPAFGERTCSEEMVDDVSGTLAHGGGIEPLDRAGDIRVQSLLARRRDASKQRLTDQVMAEGKRPLRAYGARHYYPHLLGLFEDPEKLVNVYLADLCQ